MAESTQSSAGILGMLREIRRLIRLALDLLVLPAGWITYGVTGKTPDWAGQSLIRLFCASAGRTNDLMAKLVSLRFPAHHLQAEQSALAPLSADQIKLAAHALRERGFFVYEQRVPADICDRLLNFALTQPALVRPGDGAERKTVSAVYDPARPLAVRYDFKTEDSIGHPDVQALMADPAIISLAQTYLDTEPVADVTGMWWHTAFSDQPDSEAAQLYHFDMDRIKWIKFFIYLTDVTSENGPHYFVAGSHRTGHIPAELLRRGYARLPDADVARHYRKEDFIEFAAPRGTIIAEDTRGLHKGQHVHSGHRLVLQIQFSSSLFGPAYPKTSFPALRNPRLAALVNLYPRIYAGYLPATSQS
jgi:hypothetical protein